MSQQLCPCMSGMAYDACCQPLLKRRKKADSAEALMRSRYTAYSVGDMLHVFRTWHSSTRPSLASLRQSVSTDTEWLALKVIDVEERIDTAIVEFIATYQTDKGINQLKERSHFVLEKGKWFYVEGE